MLRTNAKMNAFVVKASERTDHFFWLAKAPQKTSFSYSSLSARDGCIDREGKQWSNFSELNLMLFQVLALLMSKCDSK